MSPNARVWLLDCGWPFLMAAAILFFFGRPMWACGCMAVALVILGIVIVQTKRAERRHP